MSEWHKIEDAPEIVRNMASFYKSQRNQARVRLGFDFVKDEEGLYHHKIYAFLVGHFDGEGVTHWCELPSTDGVL